MGMHADCGHGIIMATSMAQLHMQVMTRVLCLHTQVGLLVRLSHSIATLHAALSVM